MVEVKAQEKGRSVPRSGEGEEEYAAPCLHPRRSQESYKRESRVVVVSLRPSKRKKGKNLTSIEPL